MVCVSLRMFEPLYCPRVGKARPCPGQEDLKLVHFSTWLDYDVDILGTPTELLSSTSRTYPILDQSLGGRREGLLLSLYMIGFPQLLSETGSAPSTKEGLLSELSITLDKGG